MENLYKKVTLIILLAKSFKEYRNEPIKILNRIVNDSKNELGADIKVGTNIVTGMNNAMTKDLAINKGKKYILELLLKNTNELKDSLIKDLLDIDKFVKYLKDDITSSREAYLQTKPQLRINNVYTSEEKSKYFLLRLERDFINKLSGYNIGLNINIDMNKLMIIIRKALSEICNFDNGVLDVLEENYRDYKTLILNKGLAKSSFLEESVITSQLEFLKMSKNGLEDIPVETYKKIGDIIKDIALSCPELETEKIVIDDCIKTLDAFLEKTYNSIIDTYSKIAAFRDLQKTNLIEEIPNVIKDIEETFEKFLSYNISDYEYENIITSNLYSLSSIIVTDRNIRMEVYKVIQSFADQINKFIAIQNLYVYMSTYTVDNNNN